MKPIAAQLGSLFREALAKVIGDEGRDVDPLIRVAGDERFGDYQSNVAMSLAKRLTKKPREVAQGIVNALARLPAAVEICQPFEVAGPGFINIRLRDIWLADRLNAIPRAADDDRLGIDSDQPAQTVVVDYSGPNIAKQMHVGHLRSTIIGDSIARILEFQGHRVIRQNHVGDWGTQFGMLCAYLKENLPHALGQPDAVHLADLEAFYRQANALAESDPAFRDRARAEVLALHQHEPSTIRAWQYIVNESRRSYLPIYRRLAVGLRLEDERGESFYADQLAPLVADLQRRQAFAAPPALPPATVTIKESDGAVCAFFTGPNGEPVFAKPDGTTLPMIIRKSDGAFLYATTDLAALKYRIDTLQADRVIYVTDTRQEQHFQMVFQFADAAGWTSHIAQSPHQTRPPRVQLDHVTFGSILGEDRRPLKTRSGQNVKLADLLDEAVKRAEQLLRSNEADPDKKRGFNEAQIADVAEAVGIGAVKYADLSQNRQSDYVFSWDKMLALDGNTGPYLMYAYARIQSIYRKAAAANGAPADQVVLENQQERLLARQILRFAETLESVAAGLKINLLTEYLYELAGHFMKFYETCPVLKADTEAQRASRLNLCDLTARTLRRGLDLLGIRTLERM